ncbi:hydrolase, alpha/beta fold family domain protein [Burkholderia mallei]|nr:hydrolase, alpha/beta fold family domain protein [Burkholderia mallei]
MPSGSGPDRPCPHRSGAITRYDFESASSCGSHIDESHR